MINHLIAIDDEPEILSVLRKFGEACGYRVDTTADPEIFKSILRNGRPNVVIVDLQMPDCDGVELLEYLADMRSSAAIVLSSGFDNRVLTITNELGRQLGLNMANALPKPVRMSALRAILDEYREDDFVVEPDSLRAAIEAGQLELHFQPLLNLRERKLIGWEGLVRWQHPDRGLIMPDRFIAVAEREGLIDPLSTRVAELAVRQLADWQGTGCNAFVSINLSAQNLADAQLPDRLEQLCTRHNVPSALLRLELTETAVMADPVRMISVLTRLRLKGFELAIDDFGTGYSSLQQLHRLPFSELKIDQSFVRFMGQSEEAKLIVGLTISLAHGLHMRVIAEGVESGDLADQLTAGGCDIAQGYHFGRPMPAHSTQAWMSRYVAV